MKKQKPEKFRFESGSAYEYSEEHNAYLFCGKLNGRTKKQFIKDREKVATCTNTQET